MRITGDTVADREFDNSLIPPCEPGEFSFPSSVTSDDRDVPWEFYDYAVDSHETKNIAADPAQIKLVNQLCSLFHNQICLPFSAQLNDFHVGMRPRFGNRIVFDFVEFDDSHDVSYSIREVPLHAIGNARHNPRSVFRSDDARELAAKTRDLRQHSEQSRHILQHDDKCELAHGASSSVFPLNAALAIASATFAVVLFSAEARAKILVSRWPIRAVCALARTTS